MERGDPFGDVVKLLGWKHGFPNTGYALAVAVLCTLAATGLLCLTFWGWLSGGESGSTTIRNLALVAAGLIALPLAIWRGFVAARQANTARQSLLNERYQKGAEMLGSEVLTVRLGGVYALQRLAEEYPELYHIQIMRLFCSFFRLPTKDQSSRPQEMEVQAAGPGTIRQDVEAVIEAINTRAGAQIEVERKAGLRLDLRGADLRGAQFLDADLSHAYFQHANLSQTNFADTNLSDTFFTSADLSGAIFANVNFSKARFWNAKLPNATLQGSRLPRVSLHCADLSGANLLGADLSGAILQGAILSNAWLEDADLSNAGFLEAELSGARLMKADLSGAHFLDANLDGVKLYDANLSGVRFSMGGPQTARGLTQGQLDQARADPDNPPNLTGVFDSESGECLVWKGKRLVEGP